MTISNVVRGVTPVLATTYNQLQSAITDVLGVGSAGYGYPNITLLPVAVGQKVTAAQWNLLFSSINRCIVHQTNRSIAQAVTIATPAALKVIRADFVNLVIDQLNATVTNRATVSSGQLLSDTTNAISTSNPGWFSAIDQIVTYTWPTALQENYFFNLGGRLTVALTYTNNTGTTNDITWAALIDSANTELATTANWYTATQHTGSSPVVYRKQVGDNSIVVTFTKSLENQLTVSIILTPARSLDPVNLDVTGTITNYYSRGDLGGIAAPRPQPVPVMTFAGTPGAYDPLVIKSLYIASTLNSFAYPATTTSAAQSITLTNAGNSTVSISNIVYSTTGNVIAVPTYPWGSSPSTGIPAGATVTFNIAYAGNTQGTYHNTITIVCDNDTGNLTIPTTQEVAVAPFNFSIAPTLWNQQVTTTEIVVQKFTIVPVNQGYASYAATLLGPYQPGLSISNGQSDGPVITFNPNGVPNQTINATLSITINGLTRNATISINLAIVQQINLGTWLSPTGTYNGVVGFSYDAIGTERFLTVGVVNVDASDRSSIGVGEAGAPPVANLTNGTYQYWSEVSRIPITAAGSYNTSNYFVKAIAWPHIGANHGQYFAGGSIYTITNDGYGNLTVNANSLVGNSGDTGTIFTLFSLNTATYYYSTYMFFFATSPRYVNLEPGPIGDGTQTHQFVGFTSNGTVRTILATYPGYENQFSNQNPGGDGDAGDSGSGDSGSGGSAGDGSGDSGSGDGGSGSA